MEPLGSERHGQSPRGRSAGALRSIEPSLCAILKLANPLALGVMSPAGMEPAGAGDIDEAPQGRAFGRNASQSNLRFALSLSWPTLWPLELCPRRESNPHLRFRKPLFFPLNYGDGAISDFRSRIADFK